MSRRVGCKSKTECSFDFRGKAYATWCLPVWCPNWAGRLNMSPQVLQFPRLKCEHLALYIFSWTLQKPINRKFNQTIWNTLYTLHCTVFNKSHLCSTLLYCRAWQWTFISFTLQWTINNAHISTILHCALLYSAGGASVTWTPVLRRWNR